MNQSRKSLIMQAFRKLDKTADGCVTIEDLKGVYNVSKHPKFLSGEWNEDKCLEEFLSSFEVRGNKDGKVSRTCLTTTEKKIKCLFKIVFVHCISSSSSYAFQGRDPKQPTQLPCMSGIRASTGWTPSNIPPSTTVIPSFIPTATDVLDSSKSYGRLLGSRGLCHNLQVPLPTTPHFPQSTSAHHSGYIYSCASLHPVILFLSLNMPTSSQFCSLDLVLDTINAQTTLELIAISFLSFKDTRHILRNIILSALPNLAC